MCARVFDESIIEWIWAIKLLASTVSLKKDTPKKSKQFERSSYQLSAIVHTTMVVTAFFFMEVNLFSLNNFFNNTGTFTVGVRYPLPTSSSLSLPENPSRLFLWLSWQIESSPAAHREFQFVSIAFCCRSKWTGAWDSTSFGAIRPSKIESRIGGIIIHQTTPAINGQRRTGGVSLFDFFEMPFAEGGLLRWGGAFLSPFLRPYTV